MKACLWITLISLIAVCYGATIQPQVTNHRPVFSKRQNLQKQCSHLTDTFFIPPTFSAEAETEVLEKTGKTLEIVGRLLQGEDVALTDEVQEDLIKVLKVASANGEVLSEDGSEHIWPIIIRGVAQGAIAHVVQKKLNKG
ncbi:hypothetical protein MRX96_021278 [Rhipicephalus microplus]